MGRRPTGQVVEDDRRPGVLGLRFRAYGKRRYQGLGRVTLEQAEAALRYVLADVERGVWQPPAPAPEPEAPRSDPTFHEFASEWWDAKKRELRPKTISDYEWRLTNHLLPYFARYRLSQITVQEVDRYRQAKVREGTLSAESINKTLSMLAAVLEQAVEYELMERNPAAGRRRRLRTTKPRRSYLDSAGQIGALLNAAGALDTRAAKGHPGHRHVRRRAMLATLTFAGLRLGELLALRWRDVDLSAGRLRVLDAKTAAGVRDVRLMAVLRDELAELKVSASPRADALVFPTSTGEQIGASNLRRRVLASAIKLANERLAETGEPPLSAGLTPHSLRRTFASVLYAIGEDPPTVMAEMGHTTPALALSIYAHAMRRGEDERERLRALVNGVDWAANGQLALIPGASPLPGFEEPVCKTTQEQAFR
jgi:integrase